MEGGAAIGHGFGPDPALVPRDHIIGRGFLIYWSFEGGLPDGARAAARRTDSGMHRLITSAGAFFTDTRWERTFRFIR